MYTIYSGDIFGYDSRMEFSSDKLYRITIVCQGERVMFENQPASTAAKLVPQTGSKPDTKYLNRDQAIPLISVEGATSYVNLSQCSFWHVEELPPVSTDVQTPSDTV